MKRKLTSCMVGIFALCNGCTKDTTTEDKTPKAHAEFVCNYDGISKSPVYVSFTNKSTNAYSYIWDFDDGTIETTTDLKMWHIFYTPDIYFITLKAVGEHGDTSSYFRLVSIK